MVDDLTVLLVGDDEPDEKLVQQLEKKNLNVEISARSDLGSLLALVEPHIVVHIGKEGAEATVQVLKETEEVRRVRLIILSERDALADLRGLDRTVVVSVLANDIAPSVVAARVVMLAKKGPEKSLRPPSSAATPPPEGAASLAVSPSPQDHSAAPPAAQDRVSSAAAAPAKGSPPRAESLKAKPAADQPPARPLSTPKNVPGIIREETRVILADDDVTRADLIACALREANIPTRIVPLDVAKTHWPLVREFAPTIVLGDDLALRTVGEVWLQLFQADHALRQAKLVAVSFERLCRVVEGSVNLRTLIPQIPHLSGQVHASGRPMRPPLSLSSSGPVVEAPIPFEDDDPDEFERLTVARPIDAPLPTEASRSGLPALPQSAPAAGAPAAGAPVSRPHVTEGRPFFDSLAPFPEPPDKVRAAARTTSSPWSPTGRAAPSDAHYTPAAIETANHPSKGRPGGGKLALAAIVLLVLGAAGGWLAFGKNLSGFLRTAPSMSADAPQLPETNSSPAAIPEVPDAPAPDANAPSPEELLWKVPSTPEPSCEVLVKNLEELKVGGIQQAAVSLGKARQAMVLGRLDDALTLLCEAVLVHPESLALEELAALYLTKGSPEQGLTWYEKAAALRAHRPRTLELGGDIHSQLGNVTEARAAFVASLKVKPDDEKTLKAVSKNFADQAGAEFKRGAFEAATLIYRRAATLDPENTEALAGLAATSAAVGRAKAALRWAEKTLLLDEGHHVALVVKAALAAEAGQTEEAKALAEKAIERNQNYLPAHQLRERLEGK